VDASPAHHLAATAVSLAIQKLVRLRKDDPWTRERRPSQTPPPGGWRTWLVMAGRGFGKTRTGAEFVRDEVFHGRMGRVALVGPTAADTRDVMVEGESGLLSVCERFAFRPKYEPSKRRLTFPNGARATCYSADEPNRLRGPQHDGFWADEVAAWNDPESWDMLQFGLRLGVNPRGIATTTPKAVRVVRDLLAQVESGVVAVTGGSTYENAANLAGAFLDQIVRRYEGTRLGRQELLGELLLDVPGALWTAIGIDGDRVATHPAVEFMPRIVIGVDPAVSASEDSAETGIVACGVDELRHGYVLEDASLRGTPLEWAEAVVRCFDQWHADRVIAEANNGGLMVAQTLRTVRPGLPITLVHASRGKLPRAEPVAALYEQHRVSHVGLFPLLEDQMTSFDGTLGQESPDRMDALVWALTDLMVTGPGETVDSGIAAAWSDGLGVVDAW
jgi:phage terminase large subunit-like protein